MLRLLLVPGHILDTCVVVYLCAQVECVCSKPPGVQSTPGNVKCKLTCVLSGRQVQDFRIMYTA